MNKLHFLSYLKNLKSIKVLVILLIAAAVPLTVLIAQQQQRLQQNAAAPKTSNPDFSCKIALDKERSDAITSNQILIRVTPTGNKTGFDMLRCFANEENYTLKPKYDYCYLIGLKPNTKYVVKAKYLSSKNPKRSTLCDNTFEITTLAANANPTPTMAVGPTMYPTPTTSIPISQVPCTPRSICKNNPCALNPIPPGGWCKDDASADIMPRVTSITDITGYETLRDCGALGPNPLSMTDKNSEYNSAACKKHTDRMNADLNKDGIIDSTDYTIFIKQYWIENKKQ